MRLSGLPFKIFRNLPGDCNRLFVIDKKSMLLLCKPAKPKINLFLLWQVLLSDLVNAIMFFPLLFHTRIVQFRWMLMTFPQSGGTAAGHDSLWIQGAYRIISMNSNGNEKVTPMDRNPIFLTHKEEISDCTSIHRHVLCPHYDTCLNEAVRQDKRFDCRGCLFKLRNIRDYKQHDGVLV